MRQLMIKNGVNIDTLREYGFRPKYDEDNGKLKGYFKATPDSLKKVWFERKEEKKKRIRFFKRRIEGTDRFLLADWDTEYLDIYTLYDLIQAGLVEKVEG